MLVNSSQLATTFCSIFSLVLLLSGCQLTNPYIDESKLVENDQTNYCDPLITTASGAFKCSTKLKSKYLSAMGQQAELTSLTGIGLIPLTAFTIGFAANGKSASKISDFALGSAGLYSLSSWLSAPERTKVYALGHQAVQCAEQVAHPLLINSKLNSELTTNNKGISNLVDNLDKKVVIAELAVATNPKSGYKSDIIAAISDAEATKQEAFDITKRLNQAPSSLIVTAQRINSSVNVALTDSIQSLGSLPGILSGIGDLYSSNKDYFNGFVPATSDDGDKGKYVSQGKPLSYDEIVNVLGDINYATKKLRELVTTLTPELSSKTLESCGIDTTNLIKGLTAQPTNLEFTSSELDLVHSVSINGGSGTYVYESNKSIFTIEQPTAFGGVLSIKLAKNNLAAGDYFIKVKDSTGRVLDIPVLIKAPSAAVDTKPPPNLGSEQKLCALVTSVNEAEEPYCKSETKTRELQANLNKIVGIQIEIDGNYGKETRDAIIQFSKLYEHLTGEVNELTLKAIIDYLYEQEIGEEKLTKYLNDLGVGNITSKEKLEKVIDEQDKLGIPQTGFVGSELYAIVEEVE